MATLRTWRGPDARAGQLISVWKQESGVLRRMGIKGRVLLLTLLPTSLMALLLGAISPGCNFLSCKPNYCNAAK